MSATRRLLRSPWIGAALAAAGCMAVYLVWSALSLTVADPASLQRQQQPQQRTGDRGSLLSRTSRRQGGQMHNSRQERSAIVGARVALVSYAHFSYNHPATRLVDAKRANMKAYADRHGYAYTLGGITSTDDEVDELLHRTANRAAHNASHAQQIYSRLRLSGSWLKGASVVEYMFASPQSSSLEAIMFTDLDAFHTNLDIRVEDVLARHPHASVLVSLHPVSTRFQGMKLPPQELQRLVQFIADCKHAHVAPPPSVTSCDSITQMFDEEQENAEPDHWLHVPVEKLPDKVWTVNAGVFIVRNDAVGRRFMLDWIRASVPSPDVLTPFSRAWVRADHLMSARASETFRLHFSYPKNAATFNHQFPLDAWAAGILTPDDATLADPITRSDQTPMSVLLERYADHVASLGPRAMNSHGYGQKDVSPSTPSTTMWHMGDWVGHCYGASRTSSSRSKGGFGEPRGRKAIKHPRLDWCLDTFTRATAADAVSSEALDCS
ncbi:hypothetical protein PTSG_05083 [Salpingoeca rosetta]|uniref:Uncharacterized protein n=1 Tax=Salpingoeca rosetta (strain ATCC 50818 / BSB-021) TaxID=946362 RepID=F2UAH2_SALR5|nr:uncharacterized protein PTSG_05083 [Salpingoeca rosetta]EGD73388.1 hypothetical protein PTSG_05083 [Salpingoeca rosetta]|eukprot:XP_004993670.1 hypothetical protein PTSG_05083 [Salpingoeca rosetta]